MLLQISQLQGHALPPKQAAKRGSITFHEQRAHPKTCRQQASTLIGRKIWRAHCRIIEITKVPKGVRRDRTIDDLWEILPYLSPVQAEEFSEAMQKQSYDQVAKIISNAMESNDRFDKSQRILAWKRDIRKSSSQPYSFLRSKAKAPPTKVSMVDGKPTADTCARLDRIAKVWKEIYTHHQNGEPSFRAFMETYGPICVPPL